MELRSCSLGGDGACGETQTSLQGPGKFPVTAAASVQPAAVSEVKNLIETRPGARTSPERMQEKKQRTEEDLLCFISYLFSRRAEQTHLKVLVLAVWALPGLNGDNSTIFMLLIQGYKYRLVLFSLISKYREIDKVFPVKDSILYSVPLDLLQ